MLLKRAAFAGRVGLRVSLSTESARRSLEGLEEIRGRVAGPPRRVLRYLAGGHRQSSYLPSTLTPADSKPTVLSRCCNNLPGVAIRIFIRPNLSLSSFSGFPPMTRPALKL